MNAWPADEHGTFNITSKEEKMIEEKVPENTEEIEITEEKKEND